MHELSVNSGLDEGWEATMSGSGSSPQGAICVSRGRKPAVSISGFAGARLQPCRHMSFLLSSRGGLKRLCRDRKTNFVAEQMPKQPIKLAAQRRDGVRRGRQPTLEVGESRAAERRYRAATQSLQADEGSALGIFGEPVQPRCTVGNRISGFCPCQPSWEGVLLAGVLAQGAAVPLLMPFMDSRRLVARHEGHDVGPKLVQDAGLRHRP